MSAPAAASLAPPQRIRVRWIIFLFQFAFGFVVYVQQRSLTVAGARMMPDLGLSQMQLGGLEEALLIGYTLMQFPGPADEGAPGREDLGVDAARGGRGGVRPPRGRRGHSWVVTALTSV